MVGKVRNGAYAVKGRYFDKFLLDTAGKNEVSQLEMKRLYISPFDSDLLHIILPGPLHASAQNISFHTLQALPDKRYGYLELPRPDADRLKKKLSGSILRGVRMKVEEARPERRGRGSKEDTLLNQEEPKKKEKKTKPMKSNSSEEDGVLRGLELPVERRVRRGWTEPTAQEARKSKRQDGKAGNSADTKASNYTNGPECLFKTKLPPNANITSQDALPPDKPKKRKRGQSERDVVVHEFERSAKHPSFIRDENNSGNAVSTSSYAEGRGWLDKDGNLIEAEQITRRTRSKATPTIKGNRPLVNTEVKKGRRQKRYDKGRLGKSSTNHKPQPTPMDETSSSGSSISGSEDETTPRNENVSADGRQSGEAAEDGSGLESEGKSDSEHEISTVQVRGLSISRSSPTPPLEASKEVHPLEALFKRPQNAASQTPRKPSLEVKTGFNFFDPDADEDTVGHVNIPQTPFTQQDFQERRLRSAAPTPDTAAPGKTSFGRVLSWGSGRGEDVNDEDDEEADSNGTPTASSNPLNEEGNNEGDEGEFQKWFYENRGETNRAWKRRRREAAKEKRQKTNKKH
ncbi:MAG: hypothetical protein Q9203_004983 [Teloschistes exilis]